MNSPSLSPQVANFWMEEGGAGPRMRWKQGGCHCGAVRFKVLVPDEVEAVACNCSICRRVDFLHLIVTIDQFRLLMGEDKLTTYSFNTRTAKHLFCSACGVKSFYVPRSHPEGFSVNVHCLDEGAVKVAKIVPFDGERWEEARARMAEAQASR